MSNEADPRQNLVKYGSYSEEAAQHEREEAEKGGGDFYKFSVGKNVIRILPPAVGCSSPFMVVWQHFVQLPGMSNPASFNCPLKMLGKPCPVCQKVSALRASGNPADYDLAGDYLPRLRIYGSIIVRGIVRGEEDKGPRVCAFGKSIHEELLSIREDGDFTDPISGFDVTITRVGTGKNDTSYSVKAARENTPLADSVDTMNAWIESQTDVRSFGRVPSIDEIRKTLSLAPSGDTGESPQAGRRQLAPTGGTGKTRRTAADDLG
jgi:hypothetical protein